MSTKRPDQTSYLKSLIEDLEQRVYDLSNFDAASEINYHCDDLIGQVTLTIESAMEHLNKVQTRMVNEVNAYRTRRLNAQKLGPELSPGQEKLEKLSTEIEAFKSDAIKLGVLTVPSAEALVQRSSDTRKQLRAEAFGGRFMRLFENDFLESDIIGSFVETQKDVQDDFGKNSCHLK